MCDRFWIPLQSCVPVIVSFQPDESIQRVTGIQLPYMLVEIFELYFIYQ